MLLPGLAVAAVAVLSIFLYSAPPPKTDPLATRLQVITAPSPLSCIQLLVLLDTLCVHPTSRDHHCYVSHRVPRAHLPSLHPHNTLTV